MKKIISTIMIVLIVAACSRNQNSILPDSKQREATTYNTEQWEAIVNFVAVEMTKDAMSEAKRHTDSMSYNDIYSKIGNGTIEGANFETFSNLLNSQAGENWGEAKKDPWEKAIKLKESKPNKTKLQKKVKGLRGYNEERWEKIENKINSYSKQGKATEDKIAKSSSKEIWLYILLGFLCGIVATLLIILLIKKVFFTKKAKNDDKITVIQHHDNGSGKEEEKRKALNSTNKKTEITPPKVATPKIEAEPLKEVTPPKEEKKGEEYCYLRRLSGDTFKATSPTSSPDSFYKMNLSTMEFKFDEEKMEKALMNQTSTFPPSIVEKVAGSVSTPKKVINIEPGKIKIVDSEWKVIKKIRLKFE